MSILKKSDIPDNIFIKSNNTIKYRNKNIFIKNIIIKLEKDDLQIQEKIFKKYNDPVKKINKIIYLKKKFKNLSDFEFNFFCLLFDTPKDLVNYVKKNNLL